MPITSVISGRTISQIWSKLFRRWCVNAGRSVTGSRFWFGPRVPSGCSPTRDQTSVKQRFPQPSTSMGPGGVSRACIGTSGPPWRSQSLRLVRRQTASWTTLEISPRPDTPPGPGLRWPTARRRPPAYLPSPDSANRVNVDGQDGRRKCEETAAKKSLPLAPATLDNFRAPLNTPLPN